MTNVQCINNASWDPAYIIGSCSHSCHDIVKYALAFCNWNSLPRRLPHANNIFSDINYWRMQKRLWFCNIPKRAPKSYNLAHMQILDEPLQYGTFFRSHWDSVFFKIPFGFCLPFPAVNWPHIVRCSNFLGTVWKDTAKKLFAKRGCVATKAFQKCVWEVSPAVSRATNVDWWSYMSLALSSITQWATKSRWKHFLQPAEIYGSNNRRARGLAENPPNFHIRKMV